MSQGAGLIQGILSQPTAAAPKAEAAPTPVRVQASIEVIPEAGVPPLVRRPGERFRLAPGSAYTVLAVLTPAKAGEADALELVDTVRLSLTWEGADGVRLRAGASRALPVGLSSTLTRELPLETAEGSTGARGRLVLAMTDGRGQVSSRVFEVEVGEPSLAAVMPEALKQKSRVELESAPERPEATAILHVTARDRRLELLGYHVTAGEVEVEVGEPDASLVEQEGEQNTLSIFEKVREFSRDAPESIQGWLQQLMELGVEVSLVIEEHVETRVPWEMLEVDDKPLGVRLPVVRWLNVRGRGGKAVRLHTGRKEWAGRILSYVDEAELSEAEQELAELKECHHEPCDDVEKFLGSLDQEQASRALLFVASHGILVKHGTSTTGAFGSQQESKRKVTAINVEAASFLKGERPLAFINACHSARLWPRGSGGFTGLPEVFLARVASGYLGTLGAVADTHAAAVGERVLREARKETGVCLPRLLRALREEAFERVPRSGPKAGPELARYVNTSLYVFYGSPGAWLRLVPAMKGGSRGS